VSQRAPTPGELRFWLTGVDYRPVLTEEDRTRKYEEHASYHNPPELPVCPGCGRRMIDCDDCGEAVQFGEAFARASEEYRVQHGLERPRVARIGDAFGAAPAKSTPKDDVGSFARAVGGKR
jgi:hypothetical protein